jgi:hypothetical protein
MPDRRDLDRVRHAMFEMVMARASAIACGYEGAIDLDRLRQSPRFINRSLQNQRAKKPASSSSLFRAR